MSNTLSAGAEGWVVEAWSQGLPAPRADRAASTGSAQDAAAQAEFIIRAITQLLQCRDPADACRLLANRLQQFLGCGRVAVGLCESRRRRCRLRGLSGVVRFDVHSGLVHAVQDALNEALLRGCCTSWPPPDASQRHALLAHQKLVSLLGAQCVASLPLRDGDGRIVGLIQLIDEPAPWALRLFEHHAAALAAVLGALQRAQRSFASRALRQLARRCAGWRGRAVLLAAVVVLAGLAVPVPHRVRCHCQVQPVTRRFVVAPYDGTLEKCLVAPGDVVQAGAVLARMDPREIQWELAGLKADLARARKERDAAMAAHKTSSAQVAELEMQRLQLQMQLLEHRLANLAVRSPLAGIVVTGDLEKAEGAPLTIGQSLFEIAPLEKMVFEVSIPEKDISYVQPGMPVTVSLDACPAQAIEGVLQRIHPQAETRDHDSVFVADMELDNPQGWLRPGMHGSARVSSGYRRLGWILFHEPWSRVRRLGGW